jgi:hypothetical protein
VPTKLSKKSLFNNGPAQSGRKPLKIALFLVLPSIILIIFEPEVGDFFTVFSGKGFFDSFNGERYPRWGGDGEAVQPEKGQGVEKGLGCAQNPQRRVHVLLARTGAKRYAA